MEIIIGLGKYVRAQREKGKSLLDFPSNYVLFDIETTGLDPEYDEIIEIGAIKVDNNKVMNEFHSLIKPDNEIDEFITNLTGITNEMVENAPNIEEVLPNFINFIGDEILIGHNVNFDINFVYDKTVNLGLGIVKNNYVDTMRLSRILLPELPHHRLKDLAEYYKIDTKGNHRASKDVQITNEVYLKLYDEMLNKFGTLEEFLNQCRRKRQSIKFSDIKAQTTEIDENNPFYNKAVAITGTLEKMQRKDAMQIIANLGGICQDNVNKETNFLILGNNDYNPQLRGKKSNKLIRAEELKLKGNDIEIMSENVFYDILDEYNTKSEE